MCIRDSSNGGRPYFHRYAVCHKQRVRFRTGAYGRRHGCLLYTSIMVFEPHTYSRTLDLFDEFVKCFDGADEVIFAPVYGARETGGKADSSDLTNEVNKRLPAKHLRTYDEINGYLTSILRKGDTVVFTGAGTINLAGEKLVSASKG